MDMVRTPHGCLVRGPQEQVQVLNTAGAAATAGDGVAADLVNAVLDARPDDDDGPDRAGGLRTEQGRVRILRPDLSASRPGTSRGGTGPAGSREGTGPAGSRQGTGPVGGRQGTGPVGGRQVLSAADERDFGVDMTNWSVAVGSAVVKVVATWGSADRAAKILHHLASVGSTTTPALLGHLDWVHPAGRSTVALVTELIPGAVDGWTWAVEDVLAHLDGAPAPDWPRLLGALTAQLHADMARLEQGPPVRGSQVRARAGAVLTEALSVTSGPAGDRLQARRQVLQQALDSIPDHLPAPAIHLHGDLHVGQILRAGDQYWVIDFDGDPQLSGDERNRPQIAARDVAHLLTSVDLVASVCTRRRQHDPDAEATLRTWASNAQAELLGAYQSELTAQGRSDLLDPPALRGLIVERLLRELTYAATYLPRWQYAADSALTYRYPA